VAVSFIVTTTKYLIEQLKGGKIYFGSLFQRFQSMILSSTDSGLAKRQNNMAVGVWRRKVFTSWQREQRGTEDQV
jgi:hypothetical protein